MHYHLNPMFIHSDDLIAKYSNAQYRYSVHEVSISNRMGLLYRLASKNKQVPSRCHSALFLFSTNPVPQKSHVEKSSVSPDARFGRQRGFPVRQRSEPMPSHSHASPLSAVYPLTTVRVGQDLASKTCDLLQMPCELWLVRGKPETGSQFDMCHDWARRVMDPDLRSRLRYEGRRPVGCDVDQLFFASLRGLAWPFGLRRI